MIPLLFLLPAAFAQPQIEVSAIETLYQQLIEKNNDLRLSRMNVHLKELGVQGAKGRLWPSLSFSASASKGQQISIGQVNGDVSTPEGQDVPDPPATPEVPSTSGDSGWAGQLSLGYFLYARGAIRENIRRSEYSQKSAELLNSQNQDERFSQLIQVLIEWQALNHFMPHIERSEKLLKEVESHSKSRSKIFFTAEDRQKLEERKATLFFYSTKAVEGKRLIEQAARELLPGLGPEEIQALPWIMVDYQVPQDISERYQKQSRRYEMNRHDIEVAKGYKKVVDRSRPWIPLVYLSTSHSYSGDFKSHSNDNGTSASVVFNFNFFDGFQSRANRQQATVAVEAAKLRQDVELSKRLLLLQHQIMESKVAKADYLRYRAESKGKEIRLKDVQRKQRQGLATKLEIALAGFDLVHSQMEALQKFKKHQQSLLSVAAELNEFNKVRIYEKSFLD